MSEQVKCGLCGHDLAAFNVVTGRCGHELDSQSFDECGCHCVFPTAPPVPAQLVDEGAEYQDLLDAAESIPTNLRDWQPEMHGQHVLAADGQMMIAQIRGWGYLTGTGALNLPDEEAVKIQDAVVRYVAIADPARIKQLITALRTAINEREGLNATCAALIQSLAKSNTERDLLRDKETTSSND